MSNEASSNNVSTTDMRLWQKLAGKAWACRKYARVLGNTKVGAAVLSDGKIFTGCNIEHQFHSHDIHAEVTAISNMISNNHKRLQAIVIVAERQRFTPCGACMDWIIEFGGGKCLVGNQSAQNSEINIYRANELMPYYPK